MKNGANVEGDEEIGELMRRICANGGETEEKSGRESNRRRASS
jgi:hypothetical protein